MDMEHVERRMKPVATELLDGVRAIVVNGPRQSGKSTLLAQIQRGRGPVVSLDDPAFAAAAIDDPTAFLASLPNPVAIDEFQRGGNALLLALKVELDHTQTAGRFTLAGSTRFVTMQNLAETLTGRIAVAELLPMSMGELREVPEDFIDRAFDGRTQDAPPPPFDRYDYARAIVAGGFPELALAEPSRRVRTAWCESYLATVLATTNVEQVAEVRRPLILRQLVDQVAVRSGNELVVADLAREVGASAELVKSYLDLLSTLYLVRLLPAWTTSRTNRAKRRSVGHLVDTALAAHLLGATDDDLAAIDSPWFGPLLESFVVAEVAKQATWAERPVRLAHYRDRDQREVDLVIERGQDIVAIEVKATATPLRKHARHLEYLRDRVGDRFRAGFVLHTGPQQLRLSDRITALPISTLWA